MALIQNKDDAALAQHQLTWTILLACDNMEEVFHKLAPEFAVKTYGYYTFKMHFQYDHILALKLPVILTRRINEFIVFNFSTFAPYHTIKSEIINYIKEKAGISKYTLHFEATVTINSDV